MNLVNDIYNFTLAHVNEIAEIKGISLNNINKIAIEQPKNPEHGDLAINAAMVLSKDLQMAPKELAQILVLKLKEHSAIKDVSIAGPGFLNIKLHNEALYLELINILRAPNVYGSHNIGQMQPINVEYVSTNPTGPMHIGHGRNAVFGDTIASLLSKIGYQVTREYFVNDAGGQTIALGMSLYLRYLECVGQIIKDEQFTKDMYQGEYLIPVAKEFYAKHGDAYKDVPIEQCLEIFRLYAIDAMMATIAQNLKALDITMDVYSSEMALTKQGYFEKALKVLENAKAVYYGVLEQPKGMEQPTEHSDEPSLEVLVGKKNNTKEDNEKDQLLFKSTAYGDDLDRVLKKSDGTLTYFAGDVGYHYYKIERQFKRLVNILGFDHVGYISRIKAAVKALDPIMDFNIKTTQMVNFMENGQALRMSKRAGTFITITDLIDKVGKDAVRYMMVSRHQDMPIDFDFAKVLETSKDNHLFYIQYAHARIQSVLRHAGNLNFKIAETSTLTIDALTYLQDAAELNMIKVMLQWPQIVRVAALNLEPHRICNYLYDLAAAFHSLWSKGKENTALRFIDENNADATNARLRLIKAVASIINEGLAILNIKPMDELR